MDENILEQLRELRARYADAAPTEKSVVERYGWIIGKALFKHADELGALICRQLLAEFMKLNVERPSRLYSFMMMAATKIAAQYAEFHFVPFLQMWGIQNLQSEDFLSAKSDDGKTFPSLAERICKQYMLALLHRPEETLDDSAYSMAHKLMLDYGYYGVRTMVVTRVTQSEMRGKRLYFAQLVAEDGAESMVTRPYPPKVGQLFDAVLRYKKGTDELSVVESAAARAHIDEAFTVVGGYVEHIDLQHNHIHIYDSASRHFVSSGQNIRVNQGDFVRFVPVVPKKNKFKTAIITAPMPHDEGAKFFGLREITIKYVDQEKGYCAWELVDKSAPIVELGTTEPSYVSGFINKALFEQYGRPMPQKNTTLQAIVFLKRGKDGLKRPHVALLV